MVSILFSLSLPLYALTPIQLAMFMSFQVPEDRENFYHMIIEMQTGWKLSVGKLVILVTWEQIFIIRHWFVYSTHTNTARRDPNIMETAQCHVILQNTITQSGLLDRYSNQQKLKVAQVRESVGSKWWGVGECFISSAECDRVIWFSDVSYIFKYFLFRNCWPSVPKMSGSPPSSQ